MTNSQLCVLLAGVFVATAFHAFPLTCLILAVVWMIAAALMRESAS